MSWIQFLLRAGSVCVKSNSKSGPLVSYTHLEKHTQLSYKGDYECEKGKQALLENRKASQHDCVCVWRLSSFPFKCDSD